MKKNGVLEFFFGCPESARAFPAAFESPTFPAITLRRESFESCQQPGRYHSAASVRQFSTPQNTPARHDRPTVCVFDHGSQIATEMIGDLTTPFMDGSDDVIEILSRRVGCHRSSGFLEYK